MQALLLLMLMVNSYMRIALDVEGKGDEDVADDGGDYANQRRPALDC